MPSHKEQFRNRWKGILPHFGLSQCYLSGKHGPCPFCGGKDRFRFSDFRGHGDWICNQCGSGNGFEFVKRVLNVDFNEAVRRIEPVAGRAPIIKPPRKAGEANLSKLNSLWEAAEPATLDCPVGRYLRSRLGHLQVISDQLRYYQDLAYLHEDGTKTFHPAMIALVTDAQGNALNIHRTYLTFDGRKAGVLKPKKLGAGLFLNGSAIRLTPVSESLGIAEGIETALAATKLTGTPCWAAVNCHGLVTWQPPETVQRITIFGDNDHNYVGQGSAFALAQRLIRKFTSVEVMIPRDPGDWCDVLSMASEPWPFKPKIGDKENAA